LGVGVLGCWGVGRGEVEEVMGMGRQRESGG